MLEHYLEAFDVVIVGDGNFTQVEALLRELTGMSQRKAVRNVFEGLDTPLKPFIPME